MRYCSLALNHRHFCLYLCPNKSVDSDWLILTNSLIDSMISVDNYWLIDVPPRTETDHPTINHGWSVGRPRILLFPQHCMTNTLTAIISTLKTESRHMMPTLSPQVTTMLASWRLSVSGGTPWCVAMYMMYTVLWRFVRSLQFYRSLNDPENMCVKHVERDQDACSLLYDKSVQYAYTVKSLI